MTSSSTPAKSNRVRNLILALAAIGAGAWVVQFIYHGMHYEDTDDAFVAGHVHAISAEVGGPVLAVNVRDNQSVKAGDLLVQIDPLEFEIERQKAEAGLAQAQAKAEQAKAAAAQAGAQITAAEARVLQAQAQQIQVKSQFQLARITRDRDQKLQGGGSDAAVTQVDVDNATSGFDAAQAAVSAGAANLKAMQAAVGSAQAQRDAAEAQAKASLADIESSVAAVRDAERKLAYARIAAPVSGTIGAKSVEKGDRIEAGQALLDVVEPDVWIVANFKETQLARMRPGQPVEVSIDAIPGSVFQGIVDSVAPASGAQFALLPADNATGNFTKVVQRVSVKITLDPAGLGDAASRLRPGLSAVADVRVK